jgi:integrative and conjugative element protein (TIGR02256 family)
MKHALAPRLNELLADNYPNETGGLLIGRVNRKWKRIYVTRILEAPPDSEGSPYAFKRGIQDVPEYVSNVYERTGGMIGYVGEWHTHPGGGSELSALDQRAVQVIKPYLDEIGIPTHIMIVTRQGIYSHVFPANSGE